MRFFSNSRCKCLFFFADESCLLELAVHQVVSKDILSTTVFHGEHVTLFQYARLQLSLLNCLDKLLDEFVVVETGLLHLQLKKFELHFFWMVTTEIFEKVLRSCFNILASHLIQLEILRHLDGIWHLSGDALSPTRFGRVGMVPDLFDVFGVEVLDAILNFLICVTVKLT